MSTSPIVSACALLGGQAEMARALGVTPAAVNQWCKGLRAIPAERCPIIERLTKERVRELGQGEPVTCEQLRPDVAWSVLREQPPTSELLEA